MAEGGKQGMGPDGLSEGEDDDEEPPATREVFMRHESGFPVIVLIPSADNFDSINL